MPKARAERWEITAQTRSSVVGEEFMEDHHVACQQSHKGMIYNCRTNMLCFAFMSCQQLHC